MPAGNTASTEHVDGLATAPKVKFVGPMVVKSTHVRGFNAKPSRYASKESARTSVPTKAAATLVLVCLVKDVSTILVMD